MSSESSTVGGSGSQTVSYQYGGCTYFGAPPVYQEPYPPVYYQPVYTVSNEEWQRMYNEELGVLADSDNLEGAEEVLSLFDQYGFQPKSTNYTKLIHAYGRSGKLDAAFDIFQKMQKGSIKPSAFHYHALMHQCVQNGESGKVFGLFYEMKKNSIQPNRFIFQTIIDANINKGDHKSAGRLFRKHFGTPNAFMQSGKPHLDCHGLSPETAFVQLNEFLKKHDKTPFSVIVGQGWHSKGTFQMKDYMLERLKELSLDVTEREDNPGILDVSFSVVAPAV